MRVLALLCTAVVVVAGLVTPVRAQRGADRAQQLFDKGKKLLGEKHYAEACAAFEESDKLDPGIGAKLNVARCYQEWGKLATAWRWYRDAEDAATKAKDTRARKIRAIVAEIDPTVPRLTLKLQPGASADGLVVKLDGVDLAAGVIGSEQRVDPGPHQIDTIVDGARQTKVVPVERGASAEVTLDVPRKSRSGRSGGTGATVPASVGASTAIESGPTSPTPARGGHRVASTALIAFGGGALVFAGIVTLRARDDYNYALRSHCEGSTSLCDQTGLDVTHRARRRANLANLPAIGGLAAIAGGLYLYFTSPKLARTGEHALYLAPQLDGEGGTLVFGGAF
jgi:hypothetical protein